ncbi:MAG: L,D-transpeptidase [Desulfomonilaceae bacterium]
MAILCRERALFLVVSVLACALWVLPSPVYAKDSVVKELLLTLNYPQEVQQSKPAAYEDIEKLLSEPLDGVEDRSHGSSPDGWKVPFTKNHLRKQKESGRTSSERLLPGTASLEYMPERLTRLASLDPDIPAAKRLGQTMLDSGKSFSSAGHLVGDPVSIFSGFEVQVDRKKFTLKLYGIRNRNNRSLIFQCRTGLGSPEFPTPSGTFYLVRIFDDHPLWVPPADRDWAYGQSPSHSVYGGRMIPLFKKSPIKDESKVRGPVTSLDSVAPRMQLADTGTYRIHGTDSPWSIGSGQSHGCVRLLNKSAKQLSDTLEMYVGTTTRGATDNGPYINLARAVKVILN